MSLTEVTRAESIDEQENNREDGDKKPKNRRPANTAFRQQRLKAWQPILTPKSVLPLFFIIGIIFAPIGALLIWASAEVQEISIDYSECRTVPTSTNFSLANKVKSSFKSSKHVMEPYLQRTIHRRQSVPLNDTSVCSLFFEIPNSIGPPVFMYYRLTNFYQNHRRYVKSLDLEQLSGKAVDNTTIDESKCDPLKRDPATGKAYYPCGLIANSQFNDTIYSPLNIQTKTNYSMTNKGISWDSDKKLIQKTEYNPSQVVPPPNWHDRYPFDYNDTNMPNLNEDEDFMVWMRTAGLPTFSKLSRRNDTAVMEAGTYKLDIDDRFNVTEYGGTKSILISTRSVVGGKNPFLGIAYVVVGAFCIVLGTLFTVAHLVRPRKLGDHTYLTWNNEQQSTAVATGRDDGFGSHTH